MSVSLRQLQDVLRSCIKGDPGGSQVPKSFVTKVICSWDWWINSFLPGYQKDKTDYFVITKEFTDTKDLSLSVSSKNISIFQQQMPETPFSPSAPKHLALCGSVIDPFGITFDYEETFIEEGYPEEVARYNNHLLYLLDQYIYRAKFIEVIGAINITLQRPLQLFGPYTSNGAIDITKQKLPSNQAKSNTDKKILKCLKGINALDPYINRAIFYLNKALMSKHDSFNSITPLENCVTAVSDLVLKSKKSKIPQHPKRIKRMGKILSLSSQQIAVLNDLYTLRNHETSHVSDYQWWDFDEVTQEFMPVAFSVVTKVLSEGCKFEVQNRRFENPITNWSDWTALHAGELIKHTYLNRPSLTYDK